MQEVTDGLQFPEGPVAMADGSVRFIRSSIDPGKLAAAITIADGDQTNLD